MSTFIFRAERDGHCQYRVLLDLSDLIVVHPSFFRLSRSWLWRQQTKQHRADILLRLTSCSSSWNIPRSWWAEGRAIWRLLSRGRAWIELPCPPRTRKAASDSVWINYVDQTMWPKIGEEICCVGVRVWPLSNCRACVLIHSMSENTSLSKISSIV